MDGINEMIQAKLQETVEDFAMLTNVGDSRWHNCKERQMNLAEMRAWVSKHIRIKLKL